MLVVVAGWLLLVPLTVAYTSSDTVFGPNPGPVVRKVATLYSWWTSEQRLVYTDTTGIDLHQTNPTILADDSRLVDAYRLNCGNAFTHGPHEQLLLVKPDGPRICSSVRNPHRIIGLSLFGVGVLALLASLWLPAEPERYRNRYRQPYRQRRLLTRGH